MWGEGKKNDDPTDCVDRKQIGALIKKQEATQLELERLATQITTYRREEDAQIELEQHTRERVEFLEKELGEVKRYKTPYTRLLALVIVVACLFSALFFMVGHFNNREAYSSFTNSVSRIDSRLTVITHSVENLAVRQDEFWSRSQSYLHEQLADARSEMKRLEERVTALERRKIPPPEFEERVRKLEAKVF